MERKMERGVGGEDEDSEGRMRNMWMRKEGLGAMRIV